MENLELKSVYLVLFDKVGHNESFIFTSETYKKLMKKIKDDITFKKQWKNIYKNGYEIGKSYFSKKYQKSIWLWEKYGDTDDEILQVIEK